MPHKVKMNQGTQVCTIIKLQLSTIVLVLEWFKDIRSRECPNKVELCWMRSQKFGMIYRTEDHQHQ